MGVYTCRRRGHISQIYVPCAQFCCEFKATKDYYKNSSVKKNTTKKMKD